uniref:CSON002596 protein n=1 Tax=Culicoides sonorensis TaxID=179676 RepID=A0A336L365_CULSO
MSSFQSASNSVLYKSHSNDVVTIQHENKSLIENVMTVIAETTVAMFETSDSSLSADSNFINHNVNDLTTLYTTVIPVASDLNRTSNNNVINICNEVYNSESPEVKFQFWMSAIFLSGVGLFGILGNILSMVILSRPQMKSSISAVLFGLAACDTLLIVTSLLLFSLATIYPYTRYLFNYYYIWYPKLTPFIFPIAMAAQTASAYLTITVSFERFLVVYFPLQSRRWLNYERARIYVILILLFSFIFNIPRFFEAMVLEDNHKEYGTIYCIRGTALRNNLVYIKFYVHWMYLIFNFFLPFTTLAFFNIMIYRQIRKANKERLRISRSEKREISLAMMLICVVIVFLLCNILALLLNILEAFFHMTLDNVNHVSNLLVTINSSVNFIIYVIFGEKFKRIFFAMVCKKRMTRKEEQLREDSTYSGDGSQRNSGRYQKGSFIRSYRAQKRPTSLMTVPPINAKHYSTQNSLERAVPLTTDKIITQSWTLDCS